MAYQYITEDNLVNKQNYMYSEYRGVDFLKDYFNSRKKWISQNNSDDISNTDAIIDATFSELLNLERQISTNGISTYIIERVRTYLKSFEVRKRLYSAYDEKMRPEKDARYDNYDSYLIMSNILSMMFDETKCLKYFSCLLKINDTLLSIADKLNVRQLQKLSIILKWEEGTICGLLKEHRVGGK